MTATCGGKAKTARHRSTRSIGAATIGRPIQKKKPRIPTAVSPRRCATIPSWIPISKKAKAFRSARSFLADGAATGAVGQVRRDPMAMLPFCGYNIGDYFRHWLAIGKRLTNPPLIFNVNWFRKGEGGKFLWPGFGDNMRVLKWIIDRCEGSDAALKSPIGWLPGLHDLDLAELDLDHKSVDELLEIDHEDWKKEL